MRLSEKYWAAIRVSLVFQVFLCLMTLLMTDLGLSFQIWGITMTAYWGGVIVVVMRRPVAPTRLDIFLVRWSFPFLFILAVPLVALIWKARGVMG
jgi:hypothetical protein